MFLVVHRSRAGWVDSCPSVVYGSEEEARQTIPVLADLLHKPASALAVVEKRIHDAQLV